MSSFVSKDSKTYRLEKKCVFYVNRFHFIFTDEQLDQLSHPGHPITLPKELTFPNIKIPATCGAAIEVPFSVEYPPFL